MQKERESVSLSHAQVPPIRFLLLGSSWGFLLLGSSSGGSSARVPPGGSSSGFLRGFLLLGSS